MDPRPPGAPTGGGDPRAKGFRDFVVRGNVIDLAVAVVIGAAFTAVVTATLNGLVNPLIAAVFGKPNLDAVGVFTINGAVFSIGLVLTAVINLVIVAAVLYFAIVAPYNTLRERYAKPEDEATAEEIVLLRDIRDSLRSR